MRWFRVQLSEDEQRENKRDRSNYSVFGGRLRARSVDSSLNRSISSAIASRSRTISAIN